MNYLLYCRIIFILTPQVGSVRKKDCPYQVLMTKPLKHMKSAKIEGDAAEGNLAGVNTVIIECRTS